MNYFIIITILAYVSIPPAHSLRYGGSSQAIRIQYHPYSAAIEWDNTFRCNGAIVSKLFVLTVLNCVPIELLMAYMHRFQIRVGATIRGDSKGIRHSVAGGYAERNHTHDDYYKKYKANYPSFQDLIILRVSYPFTYSNSIKPVVINSKDSEHYGEMYVLVSGWGPEPTRSCDSSLRFTMARLTRDCKIKNRKSHEICTDYDNLPEEDAYESDVGDLMTTLQGELIGIVTDDRCCQKTLQPVIYSDVSVFYRSKGKEFILESDIEAKNYPTKITPDKENDVLDKPEVVTHHHLGYLGPHYEHGVYVDS